MKQYNTIIYSTILGVLFFEIFLSVLHLNTLRSLVLITLVVIVFVTYKVVSARYFATKYIQVGMTKEFKTDVPYLVFNHFNVLIEQNVLAEKLFSIENGEEIDKISIFTTDIINTYYAKQSIRTKISGKEYILIFSKDYNRNTYMFILNINSDSIETQMLIDLNHEIRNLLTIIKGNAELLTRNEENKKAERIIEATDEVESIFESIKNIYFLDKSGAVTTDIKPILEKSIVKLVPDDWKVEIDINPFETFIDPTHASIIFKNIIENAIKYSGDSTYLSISLINGKFTVIDHGIGMEQRDIDAIFNKFYRARKVVDKNIRGYGLGMPIVGDIINIYKLSINIDSKVDQYTKIEIIFPEKTSI